MARMIAAEASPNRLTAEELHVRPGADGVSLSIEPGSAGWRYLGFRVFPLREGQALVVDEPGHEHCIVVVSGGTIRIEAAKTTIDLEGRSSPFERGPSALYLPPGIGARLIGRPASGSDGTTVAVASAPASGRTGVTSAPIRIEAADAEVEIRGAGNATRQISHIVKPDFPADRLLLVEALTPSGNWSSWPPHKHDVDAMPAEAVLEEIYHYRFRRPEAWGIQRIYRRPGTPLHQSSGPRDDLWVVRNGEAVIVPDGYHPFTATHGDDAWYLNALAGDRRTMACSFDPDLDWVRAEWDTMETDPRVPLVPRPPR